ncbi:MAG: shikimate kinase [Desulforhopalus sp.]
MHNIDKKNIVLTGFMGTGKTTVGKLLAKQLERGFVDTDQLIEARQDTTIPEIFATQGETAFRLMEAEIAEELGKREELVISTGGRLMLDPSNADALSRNGRVFCLVAAPQEILSRLVNDKDNHRPLLDVPNPSEQVLELLKKRKKGYQRFLKLATDNKQPADVAKNILELIKNEKAQSS